MESILTAAYISGRTLNPYGSVNPGINPGDWKYFINNYREYLFEAERLERDIYYANRGMEGAERANDEFWSGRWAGHITRTDYTDLMDFTIKVRDVIADTSIAGAARGSSLLRRTPNLPTFKERGPTEGVFRYKGVDYPLVSGTHSPMLRSPFKLGPGFNRYTRTHVEGQSALLMRRRGIKSAVLFINNPAICGACEPNLPHMLPSGTALTVILPNGTSRVFIGNPR